MTHHTTHATATALRAAGFPQPALAPTQVWYTPDGHARIIVGWGPYLNQLGTLLGLRAICPLSGLVDWTDEDAVQQEWCYAPTVPEIIDAMPIPEDVTMCKGSRTMWVIGVQYRPFSEFVNPNPAEAAAAAWLAQK
jgi:hypothetical protein